MNDAVQTPENTFLSGSLIGVFAKTAAPIILIMLVSGSFTLVDAYFLGAYVGPDALTAVTLMFPLFMLIVALSTLVSNGFSSVQARLLGAGELGKAKSAFAQAITLSLLVCLVLIAIFSLAGQAMALKIAKNSAPLAEMGHTYMAILIYLSPLQFVLSINSDLLRCEGRIGLMAAISLTSVLLNVVFNYFLIVTLDWGVAGSAYGTILAQVVSILAVAGFRYFGTSVLAVNVLVFTKARSFWVDFLKLGAPSSLGYMGVALSSALTLLVLQVWSGENYDATVGAYGIITRIMTFIFLPLLGLSMAFQTIVGSNFGAQNLARTNTSVKLALVLAFIYCAGLQAMAYGFRHYIGPVFVDDTAIGAEVVRLLPIATLTLFMFGPLMMTGTYFQAIGDAKRAAILGLTRTYAFALPLTLLLPFAFGEWGIWFAGVVAEVLVLILTVVVLTRRARREGTPYGLFFKV